LDGVAGDATLECGSFIGLLKAEGRHSVLEVGPGQALHGLQFVRAGIHYTGVDASEENVHAALASGLSASVADIRDLPFPAGAFSAVWCVNTLPHVTAGDLDAALREVARVAEPGAPIAVGRWSRSIDQLRDGMVPGATASEGPVLDGSSLEALGRHGKIGGLQVGPAGTGNRLLILRTPIPSAPS